MGETVSQNQSASSSLPWTLRRHWLLPVNANHWESLLMDRIQWQQPIVQVYGRHHPVPRLTMFLAEHDVSYRYSGTQHCGEGWPSWFVPLLNQVSTACRCPFNGCLLNLYRHGEDRMGWHADDEAEIDQSQPIASLSLGSSRDFQLRHRQQKQHRHTLTLNSGDLLVMHPGCQQDWLHGVPQRKRITTPRVNLTFRCFQVV